MTRTVTLDRTTHAVRWMASSRPTQFVIISDRDFAGAVADPAGDGVRYLLVPAPELGSGYEDAL
jgi:hypothetical protein